MAYPLARARFPSGPPLVPERLETQGLERQFLDWVFELAKSRGRYVPYHLSSARAALSNPALRDFASIQLQLLAEESFGIRPKIGTSAASAETGW